MGCAMGVGGSALAALAALLAPRPWMRAEGIRGLISLVLLGGHRYVTLAPHELAEAVQQHSDTVPGQCNHLRRLATSLGVSSMSNLASQLGYDGPLELLSVWASLFGSKQLVGVADTGFNPTLVLERARSP